MEEHMQLIDQDHLDFGHGMIIPALLTSERSIASDVKSLAWTLGMKNKTLPKMR